MHHARRDIEKKIIQDERTNDTKKITFLKRLQKVKLEDDEKVKESHIAVNECSEQLRRVMCCCYGDGLPPALWHGVDE